jgi:hypothetical protein
MDKKEHDNFFEKPKEVPVRKNPYYVGQGEDTEGEKESQPGQQNEQPQARRPGYNVAPMERKLPEEAGSMPKEDNGNEERIKEWKETEKEFKNKIEKLKKEDETFEIDFHEVDFGIEFVVSSGGSRVCSGALSKDGMFLKSKKSGPEEETFFPSKRDQFLRRFEDLCSK